VGRRKRWEKGKRRRERGVREGKEIGKGGEVGGNGKGRAGIAGRQKEGKRVNVLSFS
jgi:hypothetical protein